MDRVIPVLKDAVVAALIAQAARPKRRADMAGAGLIILAGLISFLALIFGSLALYTALDVRYSAQAALAIVAGALLFVALVVGWSGMRFFSRQEREVRVRSREEIRSLVDTLADDVLPGIAQPVKENPKTALAAAALAGFLTGEKIH